jgi:ABC-type polysaccharide/polyol phosphate transport system ATPase subunit
MDKEIAISVKNVSKTFKIPHEKISSIRGAVTSVFKSGGFEEFKALDDVSFEVKKGEFFGIIGRNGSGKSTLLKILAGIYQADSGSVSINGRISPFLELGIGFNPELSGRDNVYLNATVLGLTKKEIDEKFDSIVAFSELGRFIDQKLKNYSSGMQVRLAFSVSIHANREILLMDEVLAVGDSSFQRKCLQIFNETKASGRTVILVTHDVNYVYEYCDRALLLDSGKIVLMGNPKKVVNEYQMVNISNENRRIEEGNKNKKRKLQGKNQLEIDEDNGRYGNGMARISSYKFVGENSNIQNSLAVGDSFQIIMKVAFNEDVKNPVFGIMIKAANDLKVGLLGMHSLYSKKPIKIDKIEKGKVVEVVFNGDMSLLPGSYCLTLACASQESFIVYENLDIIENALEINVFDRENRKYWGLIDSNSSVIIKECL